MATFLRVLYYVWPIMAGIVMAELWRQNRSLRRQVAGHQRVIRKLTVPGGVVTGRLTEAEVEDFKRRWLEAVNQPAAAYKIRVLEPCICPQLDVTVPGGLPQYLPGKRDPRCKAHDGGGQ